LFKASTSKPLQPNQIFEDRMSVRQLREQAPKVLELMSSAQIGKVDEKQSVHFCGIIDTGDNNVCVFLPRKSKTKSHEVNLQIAKTTMRCLAKYGKSRPLLGRITPNGENTGLLATIKALCDDFFEYGIFVERTRRIGRGSGRPDWAKTLTRRTPFFSKNGVPIFNEIISSLSCSSYNAQISQIQASILAEISSNHGWWIPGILQSKHIFSQVSNLRNDKKVWIQSLRTALAEAFSDRSLRLIQLMLQYLRFDPATQKETYIVGTNDFHGVWEEMLRCTLRGVEYGWNQKIPKPYYFSALNPSHIEQNSGMRPDIILKLSSGYVVVDAKYYDATQISNSPGWPDISKQMLYEQAVRVVVGEKAEVRSYFVFPASSDEIAQYSSIKMLQESGLTASGFPEIFCCYKDIQKVMKAYISGESIELK
jgi:hypothetical protein